MFRDCFRRNFGAWSFEAFRGLRTFGVWDCGASALLEARRFGFLGFRGSWGLSV